MYCANCGVKLADSEKVCPLCKTVAYHPDIKREISPSPYPQKTIINETVNPFGLLFVVTFIFLQPIIITLLCDLRLNGSITWSAYSAGGVLLGYIIFVLPNWFRKPNPVIFAPIDFVASGLMLLYINCATGSSWFMSFAFPLLVYSCVLVCTVITLCKYVRKGYLYIFGGSFIGLAGFFIMIEIFAALAFGNAIRIVWSIYPAISCSILGIMLIIIAICKPLKESLRKKLFL